MARGITPMIPIDNADDEMSDAMNLGANEGADDEDDAAIFGNGTSSESGRSESRRGQSSNSRLTKIASQAATLAVERFKQENSDTADRAAQRALGMFLPQVNNLIHASEQRLNQKTDAMQEQLNGLQRQLHEMERRQTPPVSSVGSNASNASTTGSSRVSTSAGVSASVPDREQG